MATPPTRRRRAGSKGEEEGKYNDDTNHKGYNKKNGGTPPKKKGDGSSSSLKKPFSSNSQKARLLLVLACFWPLMLLALFAASSAPGQHSIRSNKEDAFGTGGGPGGDGNNNNNMQIINPNNNKHRSTLGQKFRNVLDRVDVMGYGPTHPRVAVVVVGDGSTADKIQQLVKSVESVFANTDLNRLFVVTVVVDGSEYNQDLVNSIESIDSGATTHWHGLKPDLHGTGSNPGGSVVADEKKGTAALDDDYYKDDGSNNNEHEEQHGRKVHVIFNPVKRGVTESRSDAVEFIRLLDNHHELAGLKSPEEDLILLLLAAGARLNSLGWIKPVTEALIVPPPILGAADLKGHASVSLKLANAVSFGLQGIHSDPSKRTSFDSTFAKTTTDPTGSDMAASSGASWPSPALAGAATALRLETYVNLPLQDWRLTEAWPADLDLALNLWLCADGIDILKGVTATVTSEFENAIPVPLVPEMAARFAAAWMDDVTAKKFYFAYTMGEDNANAELTALEWELLQSKARHDAGWSKNLNCRPFKWYAEKVNTDIADTMHEAESLLSKEEATKEEILKRNWRAAKTIDAVDARAKVKAVHQPPAKPSKPLCKECLKIVQRAKPVDISFEPVNMTLFGNSSSDRFLHLGAKGPDGKMGYVHDETALRKLAPALDIGNDLLTKFCTNHDNNYKMLHEKVYVDLEGHAAAEKRANQEGAKPRAKIFCLVYTTEKGHKRIPAIRETWGQKCDGFMVGSDKTDVSIGAVNILHEGPEEYKNIWQKVRSMWSYIYDHYYDKYDWFHIGGDDLYLIPENLRLYLESEEIQTAANGGVYLPDGTETTQVPLFLGRRFAYQGDMENIFNSGGSGYTMNKAALKTLVVEALPNIMPHRHTFSEDTMVAKLLKDFNVYPYETKDETGGERYMPFMPGHHYGYRMPPNKKDDWYAKYSINIKEGLDHCAAKSVAFHYVKDNDMKRLYAYLYHLCPDDEKRQISAAAAEQERRLKPSKPLCKECLEIVQRAKPVDISFEPVDMSRFARLGNSGDDPYLHLGAKGPDGKMGYVHDETALRRNPPSFEMSDVGLNMMCSQTDGTYKMLHEKVYVDLEGHAAAEKRANQEGAKPRAKIFCLVYTIESGHKRIPAIRETWGQKCDGFMVGSNKTDVSIGAVNILHEGPEEYKNIWQKVRSMWSYIYDHYYDKYDWFHIGGDDLYLIPENLRLYLESEEIQTAANGGVYLPDGTETTQVPLFLGRRFAYQGDMEDIFNSGGSGYTMNKAALKTLVVEALPNIMPHKHTFSEDTMVARLLKKFNVYPYETKDETGGERYMPFMPGHHYGYRMPPNKKDDWYAKYSINIKEGLDHCAAKSVAFHYVKDNDMKRLYAYLYHLCPDDRKRQMEAISR